MRDLLKQLLSEICAKLYPDWTCPAWIVQTTRPGFAGDLSVAMHAVAKRNQVDLIELNAAFCTQLSTRSDFVSTCSHKAGFINVEFTTRAWIDALTTLHHDQTHGIRKPDDNSPLVLLEYSSPNTNKPLHLGHVRNTFLGRAMRNLYQATARRVKTVQIINDRGVHICQSMVAWRQYANNATPTSTGQKGDHLVGQYYTLFAQQHKQQMDQLAAQGLSLEEARTQAPLYQQALEVLQLWEEGDQSTRELWLKMNNWVYEGFDQTYNDLGISFDKNYYESDTYLLGKDLVKKGCDQGHFQRKADGSVWINLTEQGLDEKILQRADQTTVYITQDLGTALQRYDDYQFNKMVYTVAQEQEYHFKVLFAALSACGFDWADRCEHLSYGMVYLPTGKMSSREGTVINADDLVSLMRKQAAAVCQQLGKTSNLDVDQAQHVHNTIAMGALCYHLLKVHAKKSIVFDPDESIDFSGNTGPFVQYTYARIQSVLQKANKQLQYDTWQNYAQPQPQEKKIILLLDDFAHVLQESADTTNPALLANFLHELAKSYNGFYQSMPILQTEDSATCAFRLILSRKVAAVIKSGLAILGCDVLESM